MLQVSARQTVLLEYLRLAIQKVVFQYVAASSFIWNYLISFWNVRSAQQFAACPICFCGVPVLCLDGLDNQGGDGGEAIQLEKGWGAGKCLGCAHAVPAGGSPQQPALPK